MTDHVSSAPAAAHDAAHGAAQSAARTPAWYRSPLARDELAALSRRSNLRGWLQAGGHLLLLLATGTLTLALFRHGHYAAALVALLVHGGCYGFLGWAGAGHELSHRTVFASRRLNDAFLALFAFLTWNNPVYFRASHARHHQKTVHDGEDFEVRLPQTTRRGDWLWACTFNVPAMVRAVRIVVENSRDVVKGPAGQLLFADRAGAPRRDLVRTARRTLGGHIVLAAGFLATGNWELLLLVTLAPFVGDWPSKLLALAQHYGMEPNVADFRRNSRTVLLHPACAWLYWQMNYHIEHHMYPAVPFHQLGRLRDAIANDLPAPTVGLRGIVAEIRSGRLARASLPGAPRRFSEQRD
ncbi:fatty acid desaturase [Massilia sp. METH4]|uniref:fatty acid desaturase n=1 Tax=Massilia sp. METH4 TaxID=3123041 RepID=UPI0030CF061F